ncbi:MAG: zinc metallopeptidase [Ruminococcaceae bacterium]|nr:zinc metallopeptidase [Oscillospiraceae bacterium]
MFFGLFWGDWTLILLMPAMIFAFVAQARVQSTFQKYDRVHSERRMTGADVARRILDLNGLYDVKVEYVRGHLNDHFDPRTNVIRLSDATYGSTSVAAIGVAAHEAGHAVQHATGYAPIRLRGAIIPVTQFGSRLSMPLFLIGLLITGFGMIDPAIGEILMFGGIVLFSLSTLFQLVTLPVEFNASSRALRTLEESNILYGDEIAGAKAVLSAAAMTYVAALATSLAYLLRFILIAAGASGRRR